MIGPITAQIIWPVMPPGIRGAKRPGQHRACDYQSLDRSPHAGLPMVLTVLKNGPRVYTDRSAQTD